MNSKREAAAVIIGSYVTFMIDTMLDKGDRTNGSTVKLLQHIKKHISDKKYLPYREWSNDAWFRMVDQLKDKNLKMTVAQAVENLVFDREDVMTEFYGSQILDLAGNFSVKHTIDNLQKDIVMDTNLITKTLLNEMSKVIYERMKDEDK